MISDTHDQHDGLINEIEECDILLHSGDCLNSGSISELPSFLEWLRKLNQAKHIVFIAGNHDFAFEGSRSRRSDPMYRYDSKDTILARVQDLIDHLPDNIHYLKDDSIKIEGLKIYGSPWQPEFHNWAFNLPRNGEELEKTWDKIPDDTDILLTHGPPKNVLDWCRNDGFRAGCEKLLVRVKEVKPAIHQFGHIHESFGVDTESIPGVACVNASCCTLMYEPIQGPVYGFIDTETKEVIINEPVTHEDY
jgi:predicted phosphodiesterase